MEERRENIDEALRKGEWSRRGWGSQVLFRMGKRRRGKLKGGKQGEKNIGEKEAF